MKYFWWTITIGGLVLFLVTKFLTSQNSPIVDSETLESPSPTLFECFINGKSVMTTRENCQELSIKPTPAPQVQQQPTHGDPDLLQGVFDSHMTTCYPAYGGGTNCY